MTSNTNGSPAAPWPADLLDRFGAADEITLSTRRDDGSLRGFVPIWIVTVDSALYVRSYRGPDGAWYRHATAKPVGAIQAGGLQVDVSFTHVAADRHGLLDAIGAAYRAKYARYGDRFLAPMLAEQAIAATVRLTPQH